MFNEKIRTMLENFLRERIEDSFNSYKCYNWYVDHYDDCGEEDYSDVRFLCHADRYNNGVTKIVLFYDDLDDWVIKIPILGNYIEEDDEYCDFCNSGTTGDNDYCLTETEYCEDAVEFGIGDLFAKTYYVCNINGVNFYCSERINKTYCDIRHLACYVHPESYTRAQTLKRSCGYDCYLETKELGFFVDGYGELAAEKLIQFLQDWGIEDLHHGNLGFDKDGYIKIIDCAGWRD